MPSRNAPLLLRFTLRLGFCLFNPPCAIPGGNKKAVLHPRPCLSVIISLGTRHIVSLDTIERERERERRNSYLSPLRTIVKSFSIESIFHACEMVRVIEWNVERVGFPFFPRMDEITGFSTWFYRVSRFLSFRSKRCFASGRSLDSWILILVRSTCDHQQVGGCTRCSYETGRNVLFILFQGNWISIIWLNNISWIGITVCSNSICLNYPWDNYNESTIDNRSLFYE